MPAKKRRVTTSRLDDIWNSDEWEYLSEGACSILFRFIGSASVKHFCLKVVKIFKQASLKLEAEKVFLENILVPLISRQYLPVCEEVELPLEFLDSLQKRCMTSRPRKRVEADPLQWASKAYVMDDLTRSYTGISLCTGPDLLPARVTLAVELKPKCGWLPISLLVSPENRVKYSVSRFELMQNYKQCALGGKMGWGDIGPTKSQYSPLDLFSRDFCRMKAAMAVLCNCPQNNLQLFLNGHKVFGWGYTEKSLLQQTLKQFFSSCTLSEPVLLEDETRVQDFFCTMIVSVLQKESILDRLLMGQAFDMLEIEGAWMVLQHLQELKGSKLDTAIQAVEQFHLLDQTLAQSWMSMTQDKALHYCTEDEKEQLRISWLHQAYPLQQYKPLFLGPHHALCVQGDEASIASNSNPDCTSQNKNYWLDRVGKNCDKENQEHALDAFHSNAAQAVKSLGEHECLALLSGWLLALAFSDASLMITFELSPPSNKNWPGVLELTAELSGKLDVTCQDNGCGSLALESNSLRQRFHLNYGVAVLDAGPKSGSKIQSKQTVEENICNCV